MNNNDIVTRVPPWWLGYRHKGQEVYLNSYGEIRRLTAWQRMKDRWRGFVRGCAKREFDHFTDHSITRYIEYIQRAVEEEESVERTAVCDQAAADFASRAGTQRRARLRHRTTSRYGDRRALLVLVLVFLLFLLALRRAVRLGDDFEDGSRGRDWRGQRSGGGSRFADRCSCEQLHLAADGRFAVALLGPGVAAVGQEHPRPAIVAADRPG